MLNLMLQSCFRLLASDRRLLSSRIYFLLQGPFTTLRILHITIRLPETLPLTR